MAIFSIFAYGSTRKAAWARSYRSQRELIGVFKNGKAPHRNNVELGRHGRNRTNVWTYPGATGFGRQNDEGVLLSLHPTVKPVALVADAILDCSRRGDLVLDAFLGSGTTLIAAERTGRTCYGRSALCRHDHPPLAGLCGRDRAACREWAKFCRARRGTWTAGMTKPCRRQ
jgi:DNA modification methylase